MWKKSPLDLNMGQLRPEIANLRVRKTPKRGKTVYYLRFEKIPISENDNYLARSNHSYYRPQNH